jgi:ABC-type phosphate transport system permease subunit
VIWMLSGGTATMPSMNLYKTVTSSTRGIPDTVAIEMGNVTFEGTHYGHLFLIGLILFIITLAINLLGFSFVRRRGWQV